MEFLDSFIDYDDISIIQKPDDSDFDCHEAADLGEDEIIVTDKNEGITHEIVINGAEEACTKIRQKRKNNLAQRFYRLKSRGSVLIRNLTCNCTTAWCKPRVKEKHAKKSEETENDDDDETDIDTNNRVNETKKTLITVKSYDINQQQPQLKSILSPQKGKNSANYEKAVKDLENLEKIILWDSVKETTIKHRSMGTISEEQTDIAFANLSYDLVPFKNSQNNYYENVKNNHHVYENIPDNDALLKLKIPEQYYENVQNCKESANANQSEEYESYDFGANGIYQNVVFTNGSCSIHNQDVSSKVDALQKCINEVNEIIQSKNCDKNAGNLSRSTQDSSTNQTDTKSAGTKTTNMTDSANRNLRQSG